MESGLLWVCVIFKFDGAKVKTEPKITKLSILFWMDKSWGYWQVADADNVSVNVSYWVFAKLLQSCCKPTIKYMLDWTLGKYGFIVWCEVLWTSYLPNYFNCIKNWNKKHILDWKSGKLWFVVQCEVLWIELFAKLLQLH